MQAPTATPGTVRHPSSCPPSFVTLAEGERRGGLVIRISLPASISGDVLDADGEPAQGAQVQAMMAAYPRGTRQLVSISAANTNLKGEYHLPGLQPGKYYVLLQNAAPPRGRNRGRGVSAPVLRRCVGLAACRTDRRLIRRADPRYRFPCDHDAFGSTRRPCDRDGAQRKRRSFRRRAGPSS